MDDDAPDVVHPETLTDPGALLVPDLDDGVPVDDDAEPADAVVEHHAGTDAGGAA